MKKSDLPSLDSIIISPKAKLEVSISAEEIDHINELLAGIRRHARQILKDAIEVGDWFTKARQKVPDGEWYKWLRMNFPKLALSTIWGYQKIAANREYITTFAREDETFSMRGALSVLSQRSKVPKPRVRAVVVAADAEPHVLLEAKLKNYVISLYLLRYLEVEAKGLLEAMDLSPDQVMRILAYVCKDHPEVQEEVTRIFRPTPKIVHQGA